MYRNILLVVFFVLFSSFGLGQEPIPIDAKTKEEVVHKVASIMKEKYVFPDVAAKMADFIENQHKKGEYNGIKEIKPFCMKLTTDLRSICHDKHIWVFYSPEETREVKAYNKMLPPDEIKKIEAEFYEMEKKENFGFRKLEILDGNIGYLEYTFFSNLDKSADVIIGAMKFLANTDAVIIDLRKNGGGEGHTMLTSFFFPSKEIELGRIICRDPKQNEVSRTLPYVPGKRMPKKDLYILTSSRSFSAAEGFAYTLKHLKRATIIGEKTKGGAHPIDVFIVKGNFLTQVAICESCNSVTKTNWEGVGVIPHIEVKAEDALKTAHKTAIEHLIKNSTDKGYTEELKILLKNLEK